MKELKVLVVRQPWAWLIVNGYKDIENRSWRTRYRGALLIHARLIGRHLNRGRGIDSVLWRCMHYASPDGQRRL